MECARREGQRESPDDSNLEYERFIENPPITCRKCGRRLIVECGYFASKPRQNEFTVPCPRGHSFGRVTLSGDEITDISIAE